MCKLFGHDYYEFRKKVWDACDKKNINKDDIATSQENGFSAWLKMCKCDIADRCQWYKQPENTFQDIYCAGCDMIYKKVEVD